MDTDKSRRLDRLCGESVTLVKGGKNGLMLVVNDVLRKANELYFVKTQYFTFDSVSIVDSTEKCIILKS